VLQLSNLTNKSWWYASAIRAIKTIAQSAIGAIGGATLFSQVDFRVVISGAVLAGVVSILTSLEGLPEIEAIEGGNNG
jgi:hypothetical protein